MNRFMHSLAWRVFCCILAALLILMLVQAVVMRYSFMESYRRISINAMSESFRRTCEDFVPTNPFGNGTSLREYTVATGSPVLILNQQGGIVGSDFTDCFDKLTVNLEGVGFIRLNVGYLNKYSHDLASYLTEGSRIQLKAVRLGASEYYEPLVLTCNGNTYSNRSMIKSYEEDRGAAEYIEGKGTIQRLRRAPSAQYMKNRLAAYIYDAVKDVLIAHGDIASELDLIGGQEFTGENGYIYRLVSARQTAEGKTYYFLTAMQLLTTDLAGGYVNRFMMFVYMLLAMLLTAAALVVSSMVTRPLRQLQAVTRKIARLDFSQKAKVSSTDELGMLAADINTMSDNLEETLAKLIEANRALEESMHGAMSNAQRMKAMLTNLAHEFKTPLSIISAYLEALGRDIRPQMREACFQTIRDEIDRMVSMVNDAIDLARLEAGLWKFELETVSLRELFEGALTRFSPLARERGMRIRLCAQDLYVHADRRRIEQALNNIIDNAVNYGAQGGEIELAACAEDDTARISIANTGFIAKSRLPRIWERYTPERRGDALFSGDGLGLEITSQILAMHKTTAQVRQEGDMVVFYFTLSLAPRPADA